MRFRVFGVNCSSLDSIAGRHCTCGIITYVCCTRTAVRVSMQKEMIQECQFYIFNIKILSKMDVS